MVDKNEGRKVIHFDMDDPVQNRTFKILDKGRYYQSKLIPKLVGEFFEKYGITEDTPYKEVKAIINLYIMEGEMKGFEKAQSQTVQQQPIQQPVQPQPVQQQAIAQPQIAPDALMSMLTTLLTQQANMTNMANMQAMYQGYANTPPITQQAPVIMPEPQKQAIPQPTVQPMKPVAPILAETMSKPDLSYSIDDEDDDEDDDMEIVRGVATSFKSMM